MTTQRPLAGLADRQMRAFVAVGVAAGVISLSGSVLGDFARLDDGALVGDAAAIVGLGADHAWLFRWGSLLDMLGSYLLFLPLAVYLRGRFRRTHPAALDIGTIAGVVFAGVGAAGAAALAGASTLISAHASASPTDRPHLALAFATVVAVVNGLWHFVAGPALAAWLATVAIAAWREWRGFAVYSAVLATVTALSSIGTAFMPDATSTVPMTVIFLPLATWPVWLAVRIWRDGTQRPPTMAATWERFDTPSLAKM